MTKHLSIASILLFLLQVTSYANSLSDSIWASHKSNDSIVSSYPYLNPTQRTISCTLPMIAGSLLYKLNNKNIANQRNEYFPTFKSQYDDYTQFAPLALQIGMQLTGIQGRSKSFAEMLTADLFTTATMASVVTLSKRLTREKRPDSSARTSFPSGHTAMAFASATMLHLEYGERYPWLSVLGYCSATCVGVGRILNNRHWVGDVMTGAFVGIASAEIGYWLNDLIWNKGKKYEVYPSSDATNRFRFLLPWSIGWRYNTQVKSAGFEVKWKYNEQNFVFARTMFERHILNPNSAQQELYVGSISHYAGWGYEWKPKKSAITTDISLSVGYNRSGDLFSTAGISPRIRLNKNLRWRLELNYNYRPQEYSVEVDNFNFSYKMPQITIGSALEVAL